MEPTIPNIIPVSVPVPEGSIKKFKKSTFIILLATLQLLAFIPSFFVVLKGNFFGIISFLFLIPGIVIIFSKNESLYKIARNIIIFEYAFFGFSVLGIIYIFMSLGN